MAEESGSRPDPNHNHRKAIEDGLVLSTKENLTDIVSENGAFVPKARVSAKFIALSKSTSSAYPRFSNVSPDKDTERIYMIAMRQYIANVATQCLTATMTCSITEDS